MKSKILILVTFLAISVSIVFLVAFESKKDELDAIKVNRVLTEDSYFIDWSKKDTPYEVFNEIFVGEILSIEATYIKNEDDTLSNRNIPITHYTVKVHKSIKGEFDQIIDVFYYGGYENEELVLYDYSLDLPQVGEVMILFCSQPSDDMISVDSRLFEGVYQNWGRPGTLIDLESYSPNNPVKNQNLIVRQKVKEVIDNLETFNNKHSD